MLRGTLSGTISDDARSLIGGQGFAGGARSLIGGQEASVVPDALASGAFGNGGGGGGIAGSAGTAAPGDGLSVDF